jgi:hypothetical protein
MIETRHRFDWVLRTNPDAIMIQSFGSQRPGKTPGTTTGRSKATTTPSYALSGIDRSPKGTKVVFNLRAAPDILLWPIRERISDLDRFFDTFIQRGIAAYGIGYGISWIVGGGVLWPFTLAASVTIAIAQEQYDTYHDLYNFVRNPNYVPHSKTPILIEVPQ